MRQDFYFGVYIMCSRKNLYVTFGLVTDVPLPRDVQIINMFRAVILCDRQLHIYDLDKGKLFSRLKGVLNLRMPFFGIHNDEHTMAMSRNRMYVNMLHNITGEVVTTFKVWKMIARNVWNNKMQIERSVYLQLCNLAALFCLE